MGAQNGTKKMSYDFRDFIHVFGRKRPCFHKQANIFELDFFTRETTSRWSNQTGKKFSQPINMPCASYSMKPLALFSHCRPMMIETNLLQAHFTSERTCHWLTFHYNINTKIACLYAQRPKKPTGFCC